MNDDAPPRNIPTTYRGTRFRSRLEARWAATFDRLGRGWGWSYEPYGLELGDGERYLCDFYLKDQHTWVEVKGPRVPGLHKTTRLREIAKPSDLVIIAEAPGPDQAADFRTPRGYTATIQRCRSCRDWCFHDYQHDRDTGGPGWTCRICGLDEGLEQRDCYLPSPIRDQMPAGLLDAFWPSTGGLLTMADLPGAHR